MADTSIESIGVFRVAYQRRACNESCSAIVIDLFARIRSTVFSYRVLRIVQTVIRVNGSSDTKTPAARARQITIVRQHFAALWTTSE